MSEKNRDTDLFNIKKSFWINANAGSGKTTVLIKRFLSLLINGVDISKIVVIAYTRTAAKELIERLTKKLAFFSNANKKEIEEEMLEIFDEVDDKKIEIAKSLFSKIQTENGNLRVGTIHSFCLEIMKEVLHSKGLQLPTNIGAENKMLEMELLVRSKILEYFKSQSFLEGQNFCKDQGVIDAFMRTVNDSDLQRLIKEMIGKKHLINGQKNTANFTNHFSDIVLLLDRDLEQDFFNDIRAGNKDLLSALAMLGSLEDEGSKSALSFAEELKCFVPFNNDVNGFLNVFLTKTLTARSANRLKEPTKNHFIQWSQRCLSFVENKNNLLLVKSNLAFFNIIDLATEEMNSFMSKNSFIDFDSILWTALSMLKDESHPEVIYDFISGIDHLLVDEAQDVNHVSWEIFYFIVESFFVRFGQSHPKTFFVVGDEKQSIFRFQGADIETFFRMRTKLEESSKHFNFPMLCKNLETSYRSAKDVLLIVDDIFNKPDFLNSVSRSSAIKHIHFGHKKGLVGYVLAPGEERKLPDYNWGYESSYEEKVFSHVDVTTRLVKGLLRNGFVEDEIMVIVRNRVGAKNSIAKLLNNMKNNGISVNIDKIQIDRHIVFYDFVSVCNFIASPWEDLNLVAVLRSVFFQKDFLAIEKYIFAAREKGIGLLSFIQDSDSSTFVVLDRMITLYRDGNMGRVFSYLLFERKKMEEVKNLFGNIGVQIANFILEKCYSEALFSTPKECIDSLFYGQNMDGDSGGVKVITAHSAKGTESRVVILYDVHNSMNSVSSVNVDRILFLDGTPMLVKDLKVMDSRFTEVIESAKKLSIDEEKRILYVAMTRAKERLYVVGESSSDLSWFNTIKASNFSTQVFPDDDVHS